MVISYETRGTFSPAIHGGKGGNSQGLIQFGPPERRQFGVNDRQTFAEQMPSVVSYLKTRGFKPGMALLDLYSTINAGSPGHYNSSDGNGTVSSHVAKMQREHAANVQRFLNSGTPSAPKASAPSSTGSSAPATNPTEHSAREPSFLKTYWRGNPAAMDAVTMPDRYHAFQAAYHTHNNDNSRTSTSHTQIGNVNVTVPGGDSHEIAKNIGPAIERHSYGVNANYGTI